MKWTVLLCMMPNLFLASCQSKHTEEKSNIVAKLNERIITYSELEANIPKNLTLADSMAWSESYIKQQLKEELIYEMAIKNLDDENRAEIDRLVNSYRHSLIRYKYQEQLTKERLSASFSEEEKLKFYDENKKDFILDHCLIKGLFLKIPVDAPSISEVKKWYRSTSIASIEKIEKYIVQNASVYEYFYDKWISFDEIIENIPIKVEKEDEFLRTHTFVEVEDSSFCYLLNIKEVIPTGNVAPFEYTNNKITDMLVNRKKAGFLKKFEEDLYNNAVQKGNIFFAEDKTEDTK